MPTNMPQKHLYDKDCKKMIDNILQMEASKRLQKNNLQANVNRERAKKCAPMRKHNIEIYAPLHEQKLSYCLVTYERTLKPNPDERATITAFLCRKLVSCPSLSPPYHNHQDLALLPPLIPSYKAEKDIWHLEHGQSSDHTG